MKRRMWMLAWLLPLAVLIGVGLIASGQSQPASSTSGPAGAGTSGPSGATPPAIPSGRAPGEVLSSAPASESQPALEEGGDEGAESQPASGPGAGSMPASGPGSRSTTRTSAFSRPATRYPAYDANMYTRGRNGRNDRTGRTRGGNDAPTSLPVFGPSTAWDSFSVVASRNIFIKDRSVRVRPDDGGGYRGPPAVTGLILTGTALEEDPNANIVARVAFLDDAGTGQPVRAGKGDVLLGGRVLAVSIDGIQYQKGGVIRWIALGESLTGGRVDTATMPTAAATEATATSTSSPSGGGDSVLERLRRRRQQELR